jgi:uncharacterized protein (TIGR00255 family)
MISMTGYGRATVDVAGRRLAVEIRSVNHRFFDLKLRLPWLDAAVETLVAQQVRQRFERGALTLTIRDDAGSAAVPEVRVNLALAKRYHAALAELCAGLGLAKSEISLELLVGLRDVLLVGEPERSGEALYEALRPAIDSAVAELQGMRQREGAALAQALGAQVGELQRLLARMAQLAASVPADYRVRLSERLARIMDGGEVDPQRLAQEVAIFADRTDVQEELVRTSSHLAQLSEILTAQGPIGRKLDFLLQELNREVNTIGSKAQSAELGKLVVEAKACLEKMREQAQNVE